MTPIDLARSVYDREVCARSFQEDIDLHLRYGYVFATPEMFVMGRPVKKSASYLDITCPWVTFAEPDCWWVYLAAGKMTQMFRHLPYPLPWLGWEVNNKPRFFRYERLAKWFT
jgi:hypothetical protein